MTIGPLSEFHIILNAGSEHVSIKRKRGRQLAQQRPAFFSEWCDILDESVEQLAEVFHCPRGVISLGILTAKQNLSGTEEAQRVNVDVLWRR